MPAFRLALVLATAATLCLPVAAQDGPIQSEPEFSLAFPLADIPEGVGVSCPVAINTTTVLSPNEVLRVMYVPLSAEDARVVQEQRLEQREVAYTKKHQLDAMETEESQLSPEARAMLKMIRETHWPNKTMFQLAMAQMNGSDLRVVHANRQQPELKDSAISLPDGLLVGSESGLVKVLAVEKDSRGEKAGLRANDIILQVDDTRMDGDLSKYLQARAVASKKAKLSSGRRYTMVVQNIEEDASREAVFQLPPSLNTGFMDEPIIIDSGKKDNKPALPATDVWRETPKPE